MNKQCGAPTKRGGNCRQPPLKHAERCRIHGGQQSQEKGLRKKRDARSSRVLEALGEVPETNVSPTEALLGLVTQKWAEVQWLRQQVRDLASGDTSSERYHALIWGVSQTEEGYGQEGPIDKTTEKAAISVWWEMLRKAEDQLKEYSAAALKAGVEQRQVELQEAEATLFAHALTEIFDLLNLTHEQAQLVPDVVPRVLRAMPVTN